MLEGRSTFNDRFDDYLAFLEPRIREAARVLAPTGSMFLHLDYREVHYAKVMCDGNLRQVQLRERDYLGVRLWRPLPKPLSPKHDNILWYAKDPAHYTFNMEASDRLPYMALHLWERTKPSGASCLPTPVAHHREPHGQGEEWLPDPEASWHPAAHRCGALEAW